MSFRAIEAFLVIVWNKKRVGYTYELTLKVKGELNLRGEKSVGGHIDVPEFSFGELDDLQMGHATIKSIKFVPQINQDGSQPRGLDFVCSSSI
ncbi:uncharacterized protein LOC110279553 isoform X3 [Arachis duranensis]|uniref:Uncharacterized protein LOC110279553 isoform X3 n=1 Tax=Arachis duranensis TaxID=130453 RepID=A0A9C6TKC9_ARADU|nr:uncharacterized protein LOC110279553 isoform X3 [Arachis duranensis]